MGELFTLLSSLYIVVVIVIIVVMLSLMFRFVKAVEKIASIYERKNQ